MKLTSSFELVYDWVYDCTTNEWSYEVVDVECVEPELEQVVAVDVDEPEPF